MIRIDLHTHSVASPDGSLTASDYRRMLDSGPLDYIAVTDHNRIDFAQGLQAELGDKVIVGEEISTQSGDIIGLYLKEVIPANLPLKDAVAAIRSQGGLFYVPHPFETVRHSISKAALDEVSGDVTIIEIFNGRSMQHQATSVQTWQSQHEVAGASSSDAHGRHGWGKTYSTIAEPPTRETLTRLLGEATHSRQSSGLLAKLYPKLNRLRKSFHILG